MVGGDYAALGLNQKVAARDEREQDAETDPLTTRAKMSTSFFMRTPELLEYRKWVV